jgi:two-component system NtrC family sensor kinase
MLLYSVKWQHFKFFKKGPVTKKLLKGSKSFHLRLPTIFVQKTNQFSKFMNLKRPKFITQLDGSPLKINIIQQDIGRVLLNLFNNAFYAVHQKAKIAGESYKPTVTLTTSATIGYIVISIIDNGIGIPDSLKEKILQPFFTTKPTGEGAGLGLSLSYDIVVKGHNSTLDINGNEGDGAEFIVRLPIN